MLDFLFNFSFTRPDENDATIYEVGMHVSASNRVAAERLLRERNAHLTLRTVEVFAIMNEDGDTVDEAGTVIESYDARIARLYPEEN